MRASRRDYDAIARAFKHAAKLIEGGRSSLGVLALLAEDVADRFEESNATFKRELFLERCGIPQPLLRGKGE